MVRTETTSSGANGEQRDARVEALAIGALAFAIAALIVVSFLTLNRAPVVTLAEGGPVPVRVVAPAVH